MMRRTRIILGLAGGFLLLAGMVIGVGLRHRGVVTLHAKAHIYVRRSLTDLAPTDQYVESWTIMDKADKVLEQVSRTTAGDGRVLFSSANQGAKSGQLWLRAFLRQFLGESPPTSAPIVTPSTAPPELTYQQRVEQGLKDGTMKLVRQGTWNGHPVDIYEDSHPIGPGEQQWTAPYFKDLGAVMITTRYFLDSTSREMVRLERMVTDESGKETVISLQEELVHEVLPGSRLPHGESPQPIQFRPDNATGRAGASWPLGCDRRLVPHPNRSGCRSAGVDHRLHPVEHRPHGARPSPFTVKT